ncbi:MAG: hypothetical protein LBP92_13835 [Deltaproteobacteria bacterium]|jgi:nickel transport protein|nr:hypothetical protein [Deltaproteobacteria bacterium]
MARTIIALLVLALLQATPEALAHGVVWRERAPDGTVALGFLYSDQTPMAYSRVELFSPLDAQVPFQSGVTDRNGGFAFIPDAPGTWSFGASDGQGHLASGQIEVLLPGSPASSLEAKGLAPGGQAGAGWERIALGLSAILNLALVALALRGGPGKTGPA